MAFCSKLGGLIRQSISGSNISNGSAPAMHLLNSVRYMSSSKLFVGGLSYGTDDQSLKEAFNSFGNVTDVKVITDRETGRSRGFGFVSFESEESATSAMSSMDGQELQGRSIRVSYANERRWWWWISWWQQQLWRELRRRVLMPLVHHKCFVWIVMFCLH